MTSIAELGIKVDSTDAAQASSDLDKLTAAVGAQKNRSRPYPKAQKSLKHRRGSRRRS